MPKDGEKPTGEEIEKVLQCGCGVERAIFEELVFYYYELIAHDKVPSPSFLMKE